MIICKRPAPPDDHLQKAGDNDNDNDNDNNNNNNRGAGEVIRVTEVTRAPWSRGDGTEGGEEGKGEGGEEGKGEGGDWPQKIFMELGIQLSQWRGWRSAFIHAQPHIKDFINIVQYDYTLDFVFC